jgi:DNA-binding MarR family transcriptional regulator
VQGRARVYGGGFLGKWVRNWRQDEPGNGEAGRAQDSGLVVSFLTMSKLQAEIKQAKPFETIQEELFLNLSRTAGAANHEIEKRLRPYGLSLTQYNVLRILRGAGAPGLVQHEVGERLVAQVPDVPRILSRMEKAGWVRRVRGTVDRRMVYVTLTEQGFQIVNDLDGKMSGSEFRMFQEMSQQDMERMVELLVLARAGFKCEG